MNGLINEKWIIDAYVHLRETNNKIPSETLDFMKNASLEKLKNLSERSEPPTRCCAKLPNDEEIEQVAHDEAGGHDWDDLSQRKEFVKTFIEGAKWLRSQIK